jgi:hypothetical protein
MTPRHPYVLLRCDACGELVDGPRQKAPANEPPAYGAPWGTAKDEHEAPTSGLLMFVRDGEARYEEPALCARCGMAIGVTALVRWAEEEEEG